MTAAFQVHRRAWLMEQDQKGKRQPRRQKPVINVLVIHEHVWSLARILADGDNARITNRTETSVVVANHGR